MKKAQAARFPCLTLVPPADEYGTTYQVSGEIAGWRVDILIPRARGHREAWGRHLPAPRTFTYRVTRAMHAKKQRSDSKIDDLVTCAGYGVLPECAEAKGSRA